MTLTVVGLLFAGAAPASAASADRTTTYVVAGCQTPDVFTYWKDTPDPANYEHGSAHGAGTFVATLYYWSGGQWLPFGVEDHAFHGFLNWAMA